MHIGLLTACYDPVVNGVTRMVTQYESHLTAAGHQVTIFTLGRPVDSKDTNKVVRSPAIPLGNTGYYFAPRYSREARSKLRGVDIIHCHHMFMGLEFARRYGQSPVVFTNHTRYDLYLSAYTHLPGKAARRVMRYTWPRLCGYADAVIAPSASTRLLLSEAGVQTPIELIENGIEVQRFQHPEHTRSRAEISIPSAAIVFTYVGRLSREKNLRKLVAEFSQAAHSQKDINLMLVGQGPMQETLKKTVATAGLAERIHFVDQVAPDQVPSYLKLSDAFASASLSEVHPLTVIEALAAGLPVVAIDSPGIRDVVTNDRSGMLVRNAPGSLASAISSLATNSAYRRRLAAGAWVAGANYDFRKTAERTLALYRRLLRDRSGVKSNSASHSRAYAGLKRAIGDRSLRTSGVGQFRRESSNGQ